MWKYLTYCIIIIILLIQHNLKYKWIALLKAYNWSIKFKASIGFKFHLLIITIIHYSDNLWKTLKQLLFIFMNQSITVYNKDIHKNPKRQKSQDQTQFITKTSCSLWSSLQLPGGSLKSSLGTTGISTESINTQLCYLVQHFIQLSCWGFLLENEFVFHVVLQLLPGVQNCSLYRCNLSRELNYCIIPDRGHRKVFISSTLRPVSKVTSSHMHKNTIILSKTPVLDCSSHSYVNRFYDQSHNFHNFGSMHHNNGWNEIPKMCLKCGSTALI